MDRYAESAVYSTIEEAQEHATKLNIGIQITARREEFYSKLREARFNCILSTDIPQTEEEKEWFKQWVEGENTTLQYKKQRLEDRIFHYNNFIEYTVEGISTKDKSLAKNTLTRIGDIFETRTPLLADLKRFNFLAEFLGKPSEKLDLESSSISLAKIREFMASILDSFN